MKKSKRSQKDKASLPVIGWREWVSFPDLGIKSIKAKIDTGARTSSLHISKSELNNKSKILQFLIHPKQRSNTPEIKASARIKEHRSVKSSNGESSLRPVIETNLKLGGIEHTIELTLVNRDMMGFRLLLGREAIRNNYLVDSGKSYLMSKNKRAKKRTTEK